MGTYLITGASSGIGEACAKKLSSQGHTLVLVARNEQKLEQLVQGMPAQAYCYGFDLENAQEIKSIFDFCKERNLKLDGMLYSAGVNADVPLKACSPELMTRVMLVNCISFAEMGKHFYNRKYSNEHSRIVAISSSASISCDKGMGPYSASKAALNAVVKTMAKEFVKRDVLVNALLPAGVITPMAVKKIQTMTGVDIDIEAALQEIELNPVQVHEEDEQPFGFITPGSIAEIVAYLISEQNRYITGALIPVSAGRVF